MDFWMYENFRSGKRESFTVSVELRLLDFKNRDYYW